MRGKRKGSCVASSVSIGVKQHTNLDHRQPVTYYIDIWIIDLWIMDYGLWIYGLWIIDGLYVDGFMNYRVQCSQQTLSAPWSTYPANYYYCIPLMWQS